jgi:hypothetical protein
MVNITLKSVYAMLSFFIIITNTAVVGCNSGL